MKSIKKYSAGHTLYETVPGLGFWGEDVLCLSYGATYKVDVDVGYGGSFIVDWVMVGPRYGEYNV